MNISNWNAIPASAVAMVEQHGVPKKFVLVPKNYDFADANFNN